MASVQRVSKKPRVHLAYIPRRPVPDKAAAKSKRREKKLRSQTNTEVPSFDSFFPAPAEPILSPTEKSPPKIDNIEEVTSSSKILRTSSNSITPAIFQPILSPIETTQSETEDIDETSDKGSDRTESKPQLASLTSLSPVPSERLSSPPPPRPSTAKRPSTTESIEEIVNKPDISTILTPRQTEISVIRNSSFLDNRFSTKQLDQTASDQFKQPSNNKCKTACKIIVIILIILVILSAAIVPPVFVLVLTNAPTTTTTTTTTTPSPCVSTTCIGQETPYHTSAATVIYPFNGNANDSTGRYPGTPNNSPTYVIQSYIGSSAILLNSPGSFQCVGIPYVDLSRKSFTIEVWLYVISNSLLTDYGIFNLCDFNSSCLTVSLRNGRFALSFDSMNTANISLMGNTYVPIREWVHLAVVYDSVWSQQLIYVNGRIDSISTNMVAPYRRNSINSTAIIGASQSFAYGWTFFSGRMNLFTISAGTARTACQIYNDATLTIYFPFNTVGSFSDYSVNLFNGIASNTTSISSGHLGQAIYFTTNTSYFQVQGFPEVRNVSTSNPPFTFSLWINPANSTNGGSIIHVSTSSYGNGSICYDLLALTSTGALVVQLMGIPSVLGWQGPVVPKNSWTHVAVLYSQTNGVRLFINAQLSISSSLSSVPYNLTRWDIPLYVTLGNNNPMNIATGISCSTGAIPIISGPYTGGIDDFRLYNRELNNEELCVLANM